MIARQFFALNPNTLELENQYLDAKNTVIFCFICKFLIKTLSKFLEFDNSN